MSLVSKWNTTGTAVSSIPTQPASSRPATLSNSKWASATSSSNSSDSNKSDSVSDKKATVANSADLSHVPKGPRGTPVTALPTGPAATTFSSSSTGGIGSKHRRSSHGANTSKADISDRGSVTSQESSKSATSASSGNGDHSSAPNGNNRHRGGRRKGSKASDEDKMSSEAIAFMKRLDTSKLDIPTGPAQQKQDSIQPATTTEQAYTEKNGKLSQRRSSSTRRRRASRSSTSPPGAPREFNVPPLETRLAALRVSPKDHHKDTEENKHNKVDGEKSKWASERDAHREIRMQALGSVEWRKPQQHYKPAEQAVANPNDQDNQHAPSGRRHRGRGGRRHRRSTNGGGNGTIPTEAEAAKREATDTSLSVHESSNGSQSDKPVVKSDTAIHFSDYDENEDWADDSEWEFDQFAAQ